MSQAFHIFMLIVTVNGDIISEDMGFYSIDRCQYFASRLNWQHRSPSVGPNINAYCVPQLHDPESSDQVKIYT